MLHGDMADRRADHHAGNGQGLKAFDAFGIEPVEIVVQGAQAAHARADDRRGSRPVALEIQPAIRHRLAGRNQRELGTAIQQRQALFGKMRQRVKAGNFGADVDQKLVGRDNGERADGGAAASAPPAWRRHPGRARKSPRCP